MASLVALERPVVLDDDVLVGAAIACIGRWGIAKTSFDDVAREAGCSRATVYRLFPGGKDALCRAVVATELGRLFVLVGERLAGATDLAEAIAGGIATAGRFLTTHPGLRFVVEHEPELLLPRLAFAEMDRVLATIADFAAPYLARFLPADEAVRAAEWSARIFFSYALNPTPDVDLGDETSVRKVVDRFVIPGVGPSNEEYR
jgi:AcrR family transcriptional regulator